MSQAHLFGTYDGIFSTFAFVQRQECHHQALLRQSNEFLLPRIFLFISNKRPVSEIYGGRLLERGVQ